MKTQRVNVYLAKELPAYHIQQYSPITREWLDVGGVYEDAKLPTVMVEKHNLRELLDELISLKGEQS